MKLAPSLKALIKAPHSRPGPTSAPAHMAEVYRTVARDAAKHNVGNGPWITISAAATITLNSPASLTVLHSVATDEATATATASGRREGAVAVAELIREVGLKCIGFNGIPRTINVLGAFRTALPAAVVAGLATQSTRTPTAETLAATSARGLELWRSVYAGVDQTLLDRLAESHPDLPVHILHSHYGPLFTDPPHHGDGGLASVGRALTSLVGITCLRAQQGVGPQVLSHVFGLRKAVADGSWKPAGADADALEAVRGVDWLATDDGSEWLLRTIDTIVDALGGSNFAGAKL